ncbi:ergothioneine biosynthesis protein EgtB [Halopseudomonas sp.]|uniref:ergothioneine biosynthesis protein EgtB n=1 Tax=Halopseudomonas sp. TaxID=2901191 RepID=UPI0035668915
MSLHQTLTRAALLKTRFQQTRTYSMELVQGLSAEDCQLQSMNDASPVKWHLAHTSWFFETFILAEVPEAPEPFDDSFKVLFNSYYLGVGDRHLRAERGLLSRPTLREVMRYRGHIDQHMLAALDAQKLTAAQMYLLELGLHHEQQHQELITTDLKHHFACNPLQPVWQSESVDQAPQAGASESKGYVAFSGGLVEMGHQGKLFSYDNELPRHKTWLEPFELATHNVSNREYLAFMLDGGYSRPELWLSDGWDRVCQEGWQAPLYWQHSDQGWSTFTLRGRVAVEPNAAVSHLSFYEADAYARWVGARLPTETEWELAVCEYSSLHGLFDEVWQWTNSAYLPYPGYKPAAGAVGEYNGKFMINQMVLRGSSLATPPGHARASYRNFFPPQTRWQFSGLRLAR